MSMKAYFEKTSGRGVMATAASDGTVDAAIYSTPHVQDDGSVAFIMRERLTHSNVQDNPHATYLFIEDGPGVGGVRLFLRKLKEETDPELIHSMRRRHLTPEEDKGHGPSFVVFFAVEKILPLIGTDSANVPFS